MLKINYPAQQKDVEALHKRYLACFKDQSTMQKKLNRILLRRGLEKDKRFTIEKILVAPIEELYQMSLAINGTNKKNHLDSIKKIFNYDKLQYGKKYQPIIAGFFMNSPELNTTTCYFCNIDHIYSFKLIDDFQNGLDLIKRGTEDDLTRIKGIGKTAAKKILAQAQGLSSVRSLKNISRELINNIENLEVKERNNLFTLDHVLNKAAHPIAALSLYNFVPCCYSCNSKFKRSEPIIQTDPGLSPTSNHFLFDKQVRFKLFFPFGSGNTYRDVNSISDFVLNFDIDGNSKDYDNYLKVFRLRARYTFHKKEVLELIKRKKEYSDSQIDEIAKLTKRTVLEIKKAVFGKEIFEESLDSKPLTKLKRDIAVDIEILNKI